MKKIISIFAIIALISAGGYFYFLKQSPKKAETGNWSVTPTPPPTPNPPSYPFQELTIPYLRNRGYASSLKTMEKIDQNSEYSTYLTGYTSDGLNINGLLTVPTGQQPENGWPGIVFVHGYIPPESYVTTERYVSHVDHLARNGFVVFKIDLRGHGDSEGEPGGAYYSSDYLIDTLNAHHALGTAPFVNSKKIGLWGHSMAGNVIFRSFVVKKDIPAIVIWAGAVYTYSDMRELGIEDNSYQPPKADSPSRKYRQQLTDTYGGFDPNHEFWKQIVPTNYLEGVSGAVQLNHAVDDNVVDINYSRNLIKTLANTNINYELKEYPSGGHNINPDSFNAAIKNTVDFFNRYLK